MKAFICLREQGGGLREREVHLINEMEHGHVHDADERLRMESDPEDEKQERC